MALTYGSLVYQCNICGSPCITPTVELRREQSSCIVCGSCPRYRALISMLSRELFGRSLALPDFPLRKDVVGAGMTDWDEYAKRLEEKFSYTNTYYHKAPKLDITVPDPEMFGTLDFLISTEVFEHVAPPISIAFENARKLLKEDGVMIFTVPFINTPGARTLEHFPNLNDFTIEERGGKQILINKTTSGETETYDNIIFHGGQGFALEMRLFSEESLLEEFRKAGFGEVEVIRNPDYEFGVMWREPWSLPMVARATKKRVPMEAPVVDRQVVSLQPAEAPSPAAPAPPAPEPEPSVSNELYQAELEVLNAQVNALQGELHKIRSTRMWRFAKAYWSIATRFKPARPG